MSAPLTFPASRLAQRVRHAVRAWEGASVLRVEASVPPLDVLAWLDAQPVGPQAYWHGRGDRDARAAVGIALGVETGSLAALPDAAKAVLAALPAGARLYGTARFAPEAEVSPEWAPFGRVRFVLPRVEMRSDGRTATLAVHLVPGETAAPALAALDALRPSGAPPASALPFALDRQDAPAMEAWSEAVEALLVAFDRGRLQKTVLARRSEIRFDTSLDAVALMRRLEAATPRCFHALVRPRADGPAFVSATPERLFALQGRDLATEAVAGTRPRSAHDADDDRLLDELLASEKDRHEHAFVREAIAERIAPFATSVDLDDDPSAMTLARGRHLYTGIRARLRDDADALDVLAALHPTPAVGGTPRPEALRAIADLEPFDRGLYAGPLGWIGRDEAGETAAEFAVGIRSGLVEDGVLSLYAGAGIVAGSEPLAEWAEVEHKIGDFARVIGLGELSAA